MFIKFCTYFPYPAKVWVNGHEWAKRQAAKAGIGFDRAVQRVRRLRRPGRAADDLRQPRAGAHRGVRCSGGCTGCRCPFTADDQVAGYWWELSMRQVEVSRTHRARRPALRRADLLRAGPVADNLDIGRPDQRRD